MSGRVQVTGSVNRLLWPRLRALGFAFQFSKDRDRWTEGEPLVRTGTHGWQQGLLIGRDKFGGVFGINAGRELPDGTWEYLDMARVGLRRAELSYANQAELEAVLDRIASVMENHVIRWLDEEPPIPGPSRSSSMGGA